MVKRLEITGMACENEVSWKFVRLCVASMYVERRGAAAAIVSGCSGVCVCERESEGNKYRL